MYCWNTQQKEDISDHLSPLQLSISRHYIIEIIIYSSAQDILLHIWAGIDVSLHIAALKLGSTTQLNHALTLTFCLSGWFRFFGWTKDLLTWLRWIKSHFWFAVVASWRFYEYWPYCCTQLTTDAFWNAGMLSWLLLLGYLHFYHAKLAHTLTSKFDWFMIFCSVVYTCPCLMLLQAWCCFILDFSLSFIFSMLYANLCDMVYASSFVIQLYALWGAMLYVALW